MDTNLTDSIIQSFDISEPKYDYLIGQALLVHAPYDPDDRTHNQTVFEWNNHTILNDKDFNLSGDLNIPYALFEILVAMLAIIGNAAVIFVFQQEKRLRRRTNYYIVSLALADFLVGLLGIPFAIMASVGLPRNLHACLCTVSLLIVLCTISIFCLVAVSVDRYWAILYCISYNRNVSTKTAISKFIYFIIQNIEFVHLNISTLCLVASGLPGRHELFCHASLLRTPRGFVPL